MLFLPGLSSRNSKVEPTAQFLPSFRILVGTLGLMVPTAGRGGDVKELALGLWEEGVGDKVTD